MINTPQGALWTHEMIDAAHASPDAPIPPLKRLIIAIDPAVTHHEDSDETGIIVAGRGQDDRFYILDDLSEKSQPLHWIRKAVHAYHTYQADSLVAEVNNGGDLVEKLIQSVDPSVNYRSVRATRGKIVRAEPIAALYAQNRVTHVKPLPTLENQLLNATPHQQDSPDHMDALVWALTELMTDSPALKSSSPQFWIG